jgi:6-pyruvoyltetrahydropterin/6-carboxytetrahydropterin synthase
MYHLSIESRFSAAHAINGYKGECKQLHGHDWKIQIEVAADRLNEIGMAIDFHQLQDITQDILKQFDHQYINELPQFKDLNPTAENLAKYIYEQVEMKLPDGVQMDQISIWEGEKYCVRYSR